MDRNRQHRERRGRQGDYGFHAWVNRLYERKFPAVLGEIDETNRTIQL